MNITLWIVQVLVGIIFLYSGISKSIYSEQRLIAKGQTGVEGLSLVFIRFIGISEIFGAIGIIVPQWLGILPVLTIISAFCFAFLMIAAATIHHKRREFKAVATNAGLFIACLFIAFGRMSI